MAICTKADFARELGFTPSRISQHIKSGLPVRSDGKLDREAALKWLVLNQRGFNTPDAGTGQAVAPAGKPASKPPDDAGDPFDELAEDPALDLDDENLPTGEAIRRKENYLGLKHRLEFQRRRGELVNHEFAKRQFEDFARTERDAWMAWPPRIAVLLADKLVVDPATGKVDYRVLASALSGEVRQHLQELGDAECPDFEAD